MTQMAQTTPTIRTASRETTAVPKSAGAGESLVAILAIVLVGVISAALHAGAV
jgi:hypothetical protein